MTNDKERKKPMSHFAEVHRIFERARGRGAPTEPAPRPSSHTLLAVHRAVGDPSRLNQAYGTLAAAVYRLLTFSGPAEKHAVSEMLKICSQLEAECAPPQSPWFRPPSGDDTTVFAKQRKLAARVSSFLLISKASEPERWSIRKLMVQQALEELKDS